MKRLSIITALLLGGLLAAGLASCSPHEFPDDYYGRRFRVRLVFDEDLPQLRVIRPSTKAGYAAGRTRYTAQLFRYQDESAFGLNPEYTFSFTRKDLWDLDTTIVLPPVGDKYKLALWVDFADDDDSVSFRPTSFERIVLSKEYRMGERARDAFFGTLDIDPDALEDEGVLTLLMQRPVAQIRFILPEALTFLTGRKLDLGGLHTTLRYTAPVPDTFNLLRGRSSGARSGISVQVTPEIDPSSGALVFCSDFVLAEEEQTSVSVYFGVRDDDGALLFSYTGDVPVLRAHRTDIVYGNTSDMPGGIGIDPGFDWEIEIPIEM